MKNYEEEYVAPDELGLERRRRTVLARLVDLLELITFLFRYAWGCSFLSCFVGAIIEQLVLSHVRSVAVVYQTRGRLLLVIGDRLLPIGSPGARQGRLGLRSGEEQHLNRIHVAWCLLCSCLLVVRSNSLIYWQSVSCRSSAPNELARHLGRALGIRGRQTTKLATRFSCGYSLSAPATCNAHAAGGARTPSRHDPPYLRCGCALTGC